MVSYREANDIQRAGFNRVIYGFALVAFVMWLAINRWVRMNSFFFTIDFQVIIFSGAIMIFLRPTQDRFTIPARSFNLWVVVESIANASRGLCRKSHEKIGLRVILKSIAFGFCVVTFSLLGIFLAPLFLVEYVWSFIRPRPAN